MASITPESQSAGGVPWRAIAFDLDDTLYPEAEFVRSGFVQVALWTGMKFKLNPGETFCELMELFKGGIRGTVFDSWTETRGLPDNIVTDMVRIYRGHVPQITPFPGVREMLTELGREFLLGLLSDGLLAVQQNKFSALELSQHFDAVIFSDRLGRDYWKPSTRPFLDMVEALNVSPHETVYVGDNPTKDFVACRQLGMHSIWLRHTTGIYSGLTPESEARPDYVVESIPEVEMLLKTGKGMREE